MGIYVQGRVKGGKEKGWRRRIARPRCSLFKEDGRPFNINEGRLTFSLQDDWWVSMYRGESKEGRKRDGGGGLWGPLQAPPQPLHGGWAPI